MRRFFCAIILLTSIIFTSVYLNYKLNEKADELIQIVSNESDAQIIYSWWERNDIWFEAVVDEEMTKSIYINVLNLKNNCEPDKAIKKIIINTQRVKDSLILNADNIL